MPADRRLRGPGRDVVAVVAPSSNRVGIRLRGPPIEVDPETAGRLVSRGTVPGSVQIVPGGEPIILFVDAPTTGGYPIGGVVATADLPRVGQLGPGDAVQFVATSLESPEASLVTTNSACSIGRRSSSVRRGRLRPLAAADGSWATARHPEEPSRRQRARGRAHARRVGNLRPKRSRKTRLGWPPRRGSESAIERARTRSERSSSARPQARSEPARRLPEKARRSTQARGSGSEMPLQLLHSQPRPSRRWRFARGSSHPTAGFGQQ